MMTFLRCLWFLGTAAVTLSGVGCICTDVTALQSPTTNISALQADGQDMGRKSSVPDPKELDRKAERSTTPGQAPLRPHP